MRIFIVPLIIFIVPVLGFAQTTWYVPDDYPTIQGAIDAAQNGDTIVVRPGVYFQWFDFLGKAIVVTSEKGPESVTLRGGSIHQLVACVSGEGPDTVLNGFTIREGWTGMWNFQSNPTISNCIFAGASGPGMHNQQSNPTVNNSKFLGAGEGGMLNESSSPIVKNSLFIDNYNTMNLISGYGGGMKNIEGSNPTISNTLFQGNHALLGGGGIYNSESNPTITNCTFVLNHAGGTIIQEGCGIYNDNSNPTVTNTIVWNKSNSEILDNNSAPVVTYSDIYGGYPGTGNIDADPLFVEDYPYDHDAHLTFSSPCKNAGNSAAVTDPTDHEGDPRIADGNVDMGADEFYTHLYWTGYPLTGEEVSVIFIGEPSMIILLAIGSGILEKSIPTNWGDWWNDWWLDFPIIGPIPFGPIPSDGMFVFSATLPPGWPGEIPMQAMIGDSLTNLSVIIEPIY